MGPICHQKKSRAQSAAPNFYRGPNLPGPNLPPKKITGPNVQNQKFSGAKFTAKFFSGPICWQNNFWDPICHQQNFSGPICRTQFFLEPNLPGPNLPQKITRGPICLEPFPIDLFWSLRAIPFPVCWLKLINKTDKIVEDGEMEHLIENCWMLAFSSEPLL